MNIGKMKIENFKSIKDFEFTPGRVNVVIGENGSGKTSLLEAVDFALTSNAPANPITEGKKECAVTVDIFGQNVERRIMPKKTTVRFNGKLTTQKSVNEFIEHNTGVSPDTLKLLSSSKILSGMSASDLGKYFVTSGIIPANLDFDELLALYPLTANAQTELSFLLPPAPTKFDLDDVDEAYKQVYAARKVANKQRAEMEAKAVYEGDVPTLTVEQIDKKLSGVSTYSTEKKAYDSLILSYNKAVETRKKMTEQIAAIDDTLKTMGRIEPVNDEERKHLSNTLDKMMADIILINSTIGTLEANIKIFEKTLASLDKPVCPISAKLVCTTDKTEIKEELTELLEPNKLELEKAKKQKETINNNISSIKAKIADFDKKAEAARKLETLYAQRKSLQDNLPAIPDKPVEPVEKTETLAEKVRLTKLREDAIKYNLAMDATKEVKKLEEKVKMYDELITALSPKGGVGEAVIEKALKPIITHCNNMCDALGLNTEISLKSDNGIHIYYNPDKTSISEVLPIENISSSEKAQCLFFIADAINAITGTGVLFVDDLDKLDNTSLEAFLNLLENPSVVDNYNHIFLGMVNHDDSVKIVNKHAFNIIETKF